jgi:hypothetical protein
MTDYKSRAHPAVLGRTLLTDHSSTPFVSSRAYTTQASAKLPHHIHTSSKASQRYQLNHNVHP